MGYTHYWTCDKAPKGQASIVERQYQKAIKDCQKIIKYYQKRQPKGSDTRLSGYSAHTDWYGGIEFNGCRGNQCESLSFRDHWPENEPAFCKTGRRPYDIVVVACLAVMKHRMGPLFYVDSDGDFMDWLAGVELAKAATRLKIKNPIAAKLGKLQAINFNDIPF